MKKPPKNKVNKNAYLIEITFYFKQLQANTISTLEMNQNSKNQDRADSQMILSQHQR